MSEKKQTSPDESSESTRQVAKTVSRRDFLKMAGAAGAAIGLAGGLGGLVAACGGEEEATTTTSGETATTAGSTSSSEGATTTVSAGGEAKILQIGSPVALSGFFSVQDIICAAEVKATAEWFNDNGGIMVKDQRYNIEILEEDIKSNFDGVSAAINTLVFDKGVKFLAGPGAFFNPPVSPIATANKILHAMPFTTMKPGEMDATTPYSFLAKNFWLSETSSIQQFMAEKYPGATRLGLIAVDDGGIPNFKPFAEKVFPPLGLEIVDWVGYANELQDFTPIAAKLNALDCDAYYHLNGIITHLGNIVKGLRELGNTKPYMSCVVANAKDVVEIVGDPKISDVQTGVVTAASPNNPDYLNDIIKRTQAKLGEDTSLIFDNAACLYMIVKMIEGAQSIDPTEVKTYWETQDKVDTLFGPGLMGGVETFGCKHAVTNPQAMQWLKDGQQVDAGMFPALVALP